MTLHPALNAGRVAVITGAASGIGLAAATRFASMGLKVCLADLSAEALDRAAEAVAAASPGAGRGADRGHGCQPPGVGPGPARRRVCQIRRSRRADEQCRHRAGRRPVGAYRPLAPRAGGQPLGRHQWRATFTPSMLAQRNACAIVNTGSKQGITCPPGDTAYNVSKAGVKVLTEALAHSLRNRGRRAHHGAFAGPGVDLHRHDTQGRTEKPPGAWTPDQVVDMLIDGMNQRDFYIICPDNDVTREIDNRRILWAAQDITQTARRCLAGTPTTTMLSKRF